MALKTSNKNRKKEAKIEKKQPINSWWWFHNNPKFYGVLAFVFLAVIVLV
jgi:hypothetical protein